MRRLGGSKVSKYARPVPLGDCGNVLVADDHAANRELLDELLTTQGYKVITVPDGAAALEESNKAQADLVILDVMMPHMSGFEVCKKIKSNAETCLTPVILITA
jgi:two-component system cell cycle response regulator